LSPSTRILDARAKPETEFIEKRHTNLFGIGTFSGPVLVICFRFFVRVIGNSQKSVDCTNCRLNPEYRVKILYIILYIQNDLNIFLMIKMEM
jgi:hypothetical protein